MEQDLTAILEQQLRDIHTPEAIGFWPPAIGWWILTALILVLIIFAIIKTLAHKKANAYKVTALTRLKTIKKNWQEKQDTANYLHEINALLKRALLSSGENTEIAAETGSDWAYILRTASKKPLDDDSIQTLTTSLYQKNPEIDVLAFNANIQNWIKGHQPKKDQARKGARHA